MGRASFFCWVDSLRLDFFFAIEFIDIVQSDIVVARKPDCVTIVVEVKNGAQVFRHG